MCNVVNCLDPSGSITLNSFTLPADTVVAQNIVTTVCNNDFYQYGYNGQMKVNEIAGLGNHNTALYWEFDTRTGRRWNQDPKPHPSLSNYSVFINNPIRFNDPNGDIVKIKEKDNLVVMGKGVPTYKTIKGDALNNYETEWNLIKGKLEYLGENKNLVDLENAPEIYYVEFVQKGDNIGSVYIPNDGDKPGGTLRINTTGGLETEDKKVYSPVVVASKELEHAAGDKANRKAQNDRRNQSCGDPQNDGNDNEEEVRARATPQRVAEKAHETRKGIPVRNGHTGTTVQTTGPESNKKKNRLMKYLLFTTFNLLCSFQHDGRDSSIKTLMIIKSSMNTYSITNVSCDELHIQLFPVDTFYITENEKQNKIVELIKEARPIHTDHPPCNIDTRAKIFITRESGSIDSLCMGYSSLFALNGECMELPKRDLINILIDMYKDTDHTDSNIDFKSPPLENDSTVHAIQNIRDKEYERKLRDSSCIFWSILLHDDDILNINAYRLQHLKILNNKTSSTCCKLKGKLTNVKVAHYTNINKVKPYCYVYAAWFDRGKYYMTICNDRDFCINVQFNKEKNKWVLGDWTY